MPIFAWPWPFLDVAKVFAFGQEATRSHCASAHSLGFFLQAKTHTPFPSKGYHLPATFLVDFSHQTSSQAFAQAFRRYRAFAHPFAAGRLA